MGEPFIGSESVAAGRLLKSALRTRYTRVFRDVYVAPNTELTPEILAQAGWLWSRRKGIVAGRTAAALHGAEWFESTDAVELIHTNRNPHPGLKVYTAPYDADEIMTIAGVPVTTPARTALDIGCWHARDDAVVALDALARATDVKQADALLLAQRRIGRRNIRDADIALGLMDGGAQSPRETWLRLILIDGGLPPPRTQIPVWDGPGDPFAYIDMGWEDIKVGVEYDGEHHRRSRRDYYWDILRHERLQRQGWMIVRVTLNDRPARILYRVRGARAGRLPQ